MASITASPAVARSSSASPSRGIRWGRYALVALSTVVASVPAIAVSITSWTSPTFTPYRATLSLSTISCNTGNPATCCTRTSSAPGTVRTTLATLCASRCRSSRSSPNTRNTAVDHCARVALGAHLARARRVVRALGPGAHEGVDLGVGLDLGPGRQLRPEVGIERLLGKELAGQADRGAHLLAVALGCHVVEQDRGRLARVRRAQADAADRGRPHRPDVRLEAVGPLRI